MRLLRVCLSLMLSCAVHAPHVAHADEEMAPRARMFASADGGASFAMLPPERNALEGMSGSGGRGIAYVLRKDGTLKELYRTTGWYAFELFISADGKYLVRFGGWHRGRVPDKDDLAVAFHRDGKLVKQYRVTDLVKDPSKVRATVSHYFWRPDEGGDGPKPELADWDKSFTLQTVDGWEYVFDLPTGAIKRQTRVAAAR